MAEESSIVGLPRFNNQAMALTPAAGAGSDAGVTTEMSATDTMVSIFKDMRDSLDQLVTFASKQIKPIISIPSNLTTINTSIKSSEVGGTAEENLMKNFGAIEEFTKTELDLDRVDNNIIYFNSRFRQIMTNRIIFFFNIKIYIKFVE